MKYPCLVMKKVCTTPIHVEITEEGLTEEGAPIMAVTKDLKCNYQDVAKEILTAQKKIVQITGSAYFQGDIAPGVAVITSGMATVHGEARNIVSGVKARNPDGSVNYTRIDLE